LLKVEGRRISDFSLSTFDLSNNHYASITKGLQSGKIREGSGQLQGREKEKEAKENLLRYAKGA